MKHVLIVCAHEPEFDPRIDWIARYAPDETQRTVLGFHDQRRPHRNREEAGNYAIHRISRDIFPASRAALVLMGEFMRHAPRKLKLALGAAAVVLAPLLILYEICNLAFNVMACLLAWVLAVMEAPFKVVGRYSVKKIVGRRSLLAIFLRLVAERPRNRVSRVVQRLRVFKSVVSYFAKINAAIVVAARDIPHFDVLHVNDLETLPAGVLLKWRTGCSLIYDAHEYYPYSDVEALAFEEMAWKVLEYVLTHYADHRFTVSDSLAETLTKSYGVPFEVLPNCEPNDSRNDKVAGARGSTSVRFIYQGNFAPQRGLEELIRGWAELGDEEASLHLRGPAHPYRDACIALAQELGVYDKTVYFPPAVLESELVNAAADYDVGIIPYKPDSLAYRFCCPNKLSQYMQAGLAILTNDLPTVKRLVALYGCGESYRSDDSRTVVTAVRNLVRDRSRLLTLRRAAKSSAIADFNWQQQSKNLYSAYLGRPWGPDQGEGCVDVARSADPPSGNVAGLRRDYMSGDKAGAPGRLLFIAAFDPDGIPTIYEQVKKWCGLSKYTFDLFNFWGLPNPSGLELPRGLDLRDYAGVLIHCTTAYNPVNLAALDRKLAVKLRQYTGVKVVMKQDEHFRTSEIADFLGSRHIDLLLTLVRPSDVRKFYPAQKVGDVRFLHYLTEYVKDDLRRMTYPPLRARRIDVGYRGSLQPWHFGRLGWEKYEIGERFRDAASRHGLTVDISSRWEDRFSGPAWFEFLCGVKAVLGVESGASIVDFDGKVERLTQEHLAGHPDATFEEVFDNVLRPYEGNAYYKAISPRHFEAAACGCVQVLYEGEYMGIFQPDMHYIPLRRDFSNVDIVIEKLKDLDYCQEMVNRTFDEIIRNPKYGYERFVAEVDDAIDSLLAEKRRQREHGYARVAPAAA